jgi:hypothetical protein
MEYSDCQLQDKHDQPVNTSFNKGNLFKSLIEKQKGHIPWMKTILVGLMVSVSVGLFEGDEYFLGCLFLHT